MRPLRVLLLPPFAWQPERDAWHPGAGPDPFGVTHALAARGIEVRLIDPGGRPFNPFAGRHTLLGAMDLARTLRVLMRERDADIAVSIFEGPALPLLLLRRLFFWRVPVVLWDIGLTKSWPLRERMLDLVVPRVAGIFPLSGNQVSYIARCWGRRDGVERLGHYVDEEFFVPDPSAPHDPSGPILSVGQDPGRDFDCLLDIAPDLGADLVIRSSMIPAARALPPNVAVIRERIDYRRLRELYARSRYVVVPLRETLNASGVSTILEAAAMGRALIVSATQAMRDFIVPNETCLTVPPGDRAALLAAIRRLNAEPDTCLRLGANARRFVMERCSTPVFAERFAALLRRHARPAG